MSWRDRIKPWIERAAPAAKTVERVAQLAVHMQRPTIIGAAALASAAIGGLEDLLDNEKSTNHHIPLVVDRELTAAACKTAGADVQRVTNANGTSSINIRIPSLGVSVIGATGDFYSSGADSVIAWMRQALKPALPSAMVMGRADDEENRLTATPYALSLLDSSQGSAIANATRPLLGRSRSILLTGPPGVGKTTMADQIARELDIGRVLRLDANLIARGSGNPNSWGASSIRNGLGLLSLGVVVVDDLDKAPLDLDQIEALRSAAPLVIFTANNGEHDDVLDGASMRPARVDEIFEVTREKGFRRAPFDRLADEDWDRVSSWPVAWMAELEQRLLHRPGDLRLDDLEKRLARRTRSAGGTLR